MTKIWCDIAELKEVNFGLGVRERIITYCNHRDGEGSCNKEEIIVNNEGVQKLYIGRWKRRSLRKTPIVQQ